MKISINNQKTPRQNPARGISAKPVAALITALFATVLLGGTSVQAAQYWIATSEADWSASAANWTSGGIPTNVPSDEVEFTNGVTCDYGLSADTNSVQELFVGGAANNCTGTVAMTSGTLWITNQAGFELVLGGNGGASFTNACGNNEVGTFTMSGGTLNVAQKNNPNEGKDGLIIAQGTNSTGTLTITNNATANFQCGIEIGINGSGILNVNGGLLIANSHFHVGNGAAAPAGMGFTTEAGACGSGTFNLTGGAVYILPNNQYTPPPTTTYGGLAINQGVTNAVVNISGGTLYCYRIGMDGITNAIPNTGSTDTLNICGGLIYVGNGGVGSNAQPVTSQAQFVNISGGTFHTADMLIGGGGAGANGSTNNVLSDGTNWAWAAQPPVNLTNSSFQVIDQGVTNTGPGYVTFAPETNRTITLNNVWSGVGGFTVTNSTGSGQVILAGANTYTGNTTVSGGSLAVGASGSIAGNVTVNTGGTLTLSNASAMSSTAVLTLPATPTAGQVYLNFSGTQHLSLLIIGSTPQPAGIYNASSILGGVSGVIAGTGSLTVSDLGQSYWDPTNTAPPTASGGNGSWDNSATFWYNGSSDAVWPSGGAFANFGTSAGTVTLNATMSAAGLGFTIAGYTISEGSGSPTLTLIDSADISVPSGTTTINCPLGGTTGLTETGSGTLSLGGVETYTGATTIGVGSSLIIADPGDLGNGTYEDNIINNGTFTYNSSVPQTLSGTISGAGLFNQSGSGTLTLTANSSYAGPLVISAGSTLTIGNGGGWATNSTAGGWITNNGSLVYDSTSTTLTNGDRIRGVLGTLTLSDGSLTLTMSDTCTGLTTINPGCTLIMGGSASQLASAVTNSGSFINSSSVWISSGGISGPGTVTVSGGKLTFSGANTYTGNTTVSGGTLSLTNGGSIIASPNIIVANGATFDVSGLLNTNTVVNLFTNICLLASGQTLSNSSPTAILAGSINSGLGTISLTYASGTPSFAVTNGTLTLSPSTTFNVNNTGPSALGPGTYTLIGTEVGGVVAGTVPSSYTVGGYGVSGTSSLIISTSNTLDLVVVSSSPVVSPIISGPSVKVTVNGNPTFSGNSGSPNCIYGVESTTSLSGTPVWIEATNVVATPGVPGVTTGSDGSWSFTDANQTNPPTIFYRLYNPDDPTSPPQ